LTVGYVIVKVNGAAFALGAGKFRRKEGKRIV
jgi:hypothetical protein